MDTTYYWENGFQYVVKDGCAIVTSAIVTVHDQEMTVPPSLGGYPVTALGSRAFYANDLLVRIVLPKTVSLIANSCFESCSSLVEVSAPNVEGILSRSFRDCVSLKKVTAPSVTAVGLDAFYGCEGLTYVTLPESCHHLGPYAFARCSSLVSIDLGGISSIPEWGFYGCQSLEQVEVSDACKAVGAWAFGDTGLKVFSANVTLIRECAFRGCEELEVVCLPMVKSIERCAFSETPKLKELHLSSQVEQIDDEAFGNHRASTFTINSGGIQVWEFCSNHRIGWKV